MRNSFWFIKGIDLLSGLDKESLHKVSRASRIDRYQQKQIFSLPNAPALSVYLLNSGRMQYVRLLDENNEGASVEIVRGEIFGKIPDPGGHVFPFFLEALDNVEIWVLSKPDFQRFFMNEAQGRSFSSYTGILKRRRLENNIWLLLYTDIPERIASLLLDFARLFGKESKGGLLLGIKLSLQNLAHLTGTTPSFVLLALAGFINRGHIEMVRNRIVIKNQAALKLLSRRGHDVA